MPEPLQTPWYNYLDEYEECPECHRMVTCKAESLCAECYQAKIAEEMVEQLADYEPFNDGG